jgi:hypothetical protein
MVVAWSVYYNLLSADQKAVYTDLEKKFDKASNEQDVHQMMFNTEYDKFKETDEYKEIDKWWNEENHRKSWGEHHNRLIDAEKIVCKKYNIKTDMTRMMLREATNVTSMYNRMMERYRSAARRLIIIPDAKGVATDDETKQCTICTVNIKDNALPCGHVYCVECVGKMTCKCPNCKKEFVKNKVIKLYM